MLYQRKYVWLATFIKFQYSIPIIGWMDPRICELRPSLCGFIQNQKKL